MMFCDVSSLDEANGMGIRDDGEESTDKIQERRQSTLNAMYHNYIFILFYSHYCNNFLKKINYCNCGRYCQTIDHVGQVTHHTVETHRDKLTKTS